MNTYAFESIKVQSFKHAVNVREKPNLCEKDKTMLRDYNLDEKVVEEYCSCVDFECMNRIFHGIAIRNMHNGFEFFNSEECKSPKTIGLSGLVVIVNSLKLYDRSCLLFENFVDLLAYLTLKKHKLLGRYIKISSECDYIVLNDTSNYSYLIEKTKEYSHFYCFFSHTILGETLTLSLTSLYLYKTKDCSKLYSRCRTIADFLRLRKGVL